MLRIRFWLLASMVILAAVGFSVQTGLNSNLHAQDDGSEQEGDKDNEPIKLRNITVYKNEKYFEVPGRIQLNRGPIEFFACAPGSDKLHEVICVANCSPSDFKFGMIFLGFKDTDSKPVRYEDDGTVRLPEGPRCVISLEWQSEGKTVRYRIEDLILNARTGKPLRYNGWVYTGSQTRKNPETGNTDFLADIVKILIAVYHDPTTVIDNPSITGSDDSFFHANHELLPAPGTDIKLIVSHPTDEDAARWKKWEEEGDDESNLVLKQAEIEFEKIPVEKIYTGLTSDFEDEYGERILTREAWAEVWGRFHAKASEQPPLPEIDFEKQMVVTWYCGVQPTDGYGVTYESIEQGPDYVYAFYKKYEPGKNDVVITKETSPWVAAVVPRKQLNVLPLPYYGAVTDWHGDGRSTLSQEKIVIRDKAQWDALWKKLTQKDGVGPKTPDINFEKFMVVGIILDPVNKKGVSVQVADLVVRRDGETDKDILIKYTVYEGDQEPTETAVCPYHVVVVKKSDLNPVFVQVE